MRKKLLIMIAFAMTLCLIGCGSDFDDAPDYPDNELAVIVWYENYAWEPTSQGYFVTCGGDVYLFDFIGDEVDAELYDRSFDAIHSAITDNSGLAEIFEELRSKKEPYDRIDNDILQLCRMVADNIDPSASFEIEHTACDAGNESVYVMTDGGPIKIYTEGDNTGTISDMTAKKILKKLRKSDIIDEAWDIRNSGHRPAGFYDYPGQTK